MLKKSGITFNLRPNYRKNKNKNKNWNMGQYGPVAAPSGPARPVA